MGTDLMRYDKLVEGALRGVMVEALRRVARKGLPGGHHFYISFRTDHQGARVSAELKARYPEEMTIVLQHQFWGLEIDDEGFEVSLNFDSVAERLVIPFESVTAFADPSVKFGLQFQPPGGAGAKVASLDDAAKPAAEHDAKPAAEGAGEVVTLDAFRKK